MQKHSVRILCSLLLACALLLLAACGQESISDEKNKVDNAADLAQDGEKADEINKGAEAEKKADEGKDMSPVSPADMQKNRSDLLLGKFQLDGKDFQLSVPFTEIQALGWTFENTDLNESTSVYDLSLGEVWMIRDVQGQEKRIYLSLVPASEEKPEIQNALIYKIGTSALVYRDGEPVEGLDADLVLPGGLHAYDELASFQQQYGDPSYRDDGYVTIEYGYGVIEYLPFWQRDVLYSGLTFSPKKVITLSINQNLPFIDPEDVDGQNLEVPEGIESLLPEPETISKGGLEFQVPFLAADLLNDGWRIFDVHPLNGEFESSDSRGVLRGSEHVVRMDGKKCGAEVNLSFEKEGNVLSTILINYGQSNAAYENCYVSEISAYYPVQP